MARPSFHASATRPYPPGEYPVVVVGSGPGGLQLAYGLNRYGIRHAVISADPGPGGMFRRWPLFQRLLSWTKPHAAGGPGSRPFERCDWNSLIAEEPEARSLAARHLDGTSHYPTRAAMEANLAAFAERTGLAVRYGCRWLQTRREEDADGARFVLETSDGDYACRDAVFAVGVADPWNPDIPGIELARHYADVGPAERYADRRVVILGKQNSGFEIASGLLPWARSILLSSPSPARLSVVVNSLVGVRARYILPYEDYVLGGGVGVLDAATERIERRGDALVVHFRMTGSNDAVAVEVDDVISATGFTTPLRDLPKLGLTTFGQSGLPAQTRWWESTTVPGLHFAGTITQGVRGLAKFGIPPNSGAVQGHRYNALILARRLASKRFGIEIPHPRLAPDAVVPFLLDEATRGPELWHQKGFLARVLTVGADEGIRDAGIIPLAAFLDEEERDGIALVLEADGSGAMYPVAYVRAGGHLTETPLPPDAMLNYESGAHRRALGAALQPLGIG